MEERYHWRKYIIISFSGIALMVGLSLLARATIPEVVKEGVSQMNLVAGWLAVMGAFSFACLITFGLAMTFWGVLNVATDISDYRGSRKNKE